MELSAQDNERIDAALTLASRICHKYTCPGVEYSDLFSIAMEAVTVAWNAWPKEGRFDVYAARRVRWRILDELRKHQKELHPPEVNRPKRRQASREPTPRETQVWGAMSEGLNREEIAERMGITIRTVDALIQSLRRRLGCYGNSAALGRMWAERKPI